MTSLENSSGKLLRELDLFDSVMILIGIFIGTAIFLVTGDIAGVVPAPGWILLSFVVATLIAIIGALTVAELGVTLPYAGGQYVYLKEAFGPAAGFLYGWAFLVVFWNGGNAAISVAFAEFLSHFFPALSPQNVILSLRFPGFPLNISSGQVVAVTAVAGLSVLHYYGLRLGVTVQNVFTSLKIVAIIFLVGAGLFLGRGGNLQLDGFFSTSGFKFPWYKAFGIALIACTWVYDGWYALACMAGEMKNVKRNLPLGMVLGILVALVMFTIVNLVYFRALPMSGIAGCPDVGVAAARALTGAWGATVISALMVFSAFACLNVCLIAGPRVYYAMAKDKLFFSRLAYVHPHYHTPGPAIFVQGLWTVVLCFSGTYKDLYEYVAFSTFIFYFLTGLALFSLRRKHPEWPRPYRTWGYPVTPLIFIVVNGLLFINQLLAEPKKSIVALLILGAGLPAYYYWKKKDTSVVDEAGES